MDALVLVVTFGACSVGRCHQVLKLFGNLQQISEVLKDKPSTSSSAAGGSKKKVGAYFK